MKRFTRDEIASRVARDIPEGSYVNLGIGLPTLVANHLDPSREVCVLGAFQVSRQGDLANWHTGAPDAIPAVGGAMDLAIGAKRVFVMMEHQTKSGESKIVEHCTYPLTGMACVSRIYTDLAVIDITANGLVVLEMAEGLTLPELEKLSGVPLAAA